MTKDSHRGRSGLGTRSAHVITTFTSTTAHTWRTKMGPFLVSAKAKLYLRSSIRHL